MCGVGWLSLLLHCVAVSRPRNRNRCEVDPAFEKLIPADTLFIAGANVESVRNTVTYQKFLSVFRCPSWTISPVRPGLTRARIFRRSVMLER